MTDRGPARGAATAPPRTPRTAGEMLARSKEFLARKGAGEARLEAELLVAHALGLDRLGLYMALDRPVTAEEIVRARDLVARRGRGEPVAYLTGAREFYGRRFAVGPGCLVPRPETELLVDVAREWHAALEPRRLVGADLGTGSGCLAVTLALELHGLAITGVDVSDTALVFAEENAEALGAGVELVRADGLAWLAALPDGALDLLVSNPPYVDPAERDALPVDVREHEPPEALFAPAGDPDRFVRELLDGAPRLLRPGGLLAVELGSDQGPRVERLARERGLDVRFRRDLAGHDRVAELRRG